MSHERSGQVPAGVVSAAEHIRSMPSLARDGDQRFDSSLSHTL
jgi:hypothetical protein